MTPLSFIEKEIGRRLKRRLPFIGIAQTVLQKAEIANRLAGHHEWHAFLVYDRSELIADDLVFVEQHNTAVSTTVPTDGVIQLVHQGRKVNGWIHSHHQLPIGTEFSLTDRRNSKFLTNQFGFSLDIGTVYWCRHRVTGIFSLVVDHRCRYQALLTCKVVKSGKKPDYYLIPNYPTRIVEGTDFDRARFGSELKALLNHSRRGSKAQSEARPA